MDKSDLLSWQKGGLSYIRDEEPDVLCIQETKCAAEDIPDDVKVEGYTDYWSSAEQAGYAGTAMYCKVKPVNVTYGLGKVGSLSYNVFNHLPDLPISVSSNLAANKDMVSKILTNGDTIM